MSDVKMLMDEINALKRRIAQLEARTEHPGFAASDVMRLGTAQTATAAKTFPNTGLKIKDTDDSHALTVAPGSNLTADRTLTLTTGDANRTLTLTGNATLNDWFDQAVKVASSPTFAGGKFTGRADFGPGGDTVNNALDDAVFGSTSGTGNGVTILTNTTSIGYVGFQDTSGLTPQGFVAYDHNIDALLFRANTSEKQRILANGNVLIGTTTDSGYKLDVTGKGRVNQSSTTAAVPVLTLTQADDDIAFIDYTGTSAASAAKSISTWTTGNSIQGFARIRINGTTYWMPFYNAPTS